VRGESGQYVVWVVDKSSSGEASTKPNTRTVALKPDRLKKVLQSLMAARVPAGSPLSLIDYDVVALFDGGHPESGRLMLNQLQDKERR
jgi:hypothetical protein